MMAEGGDWLMVNPCERRHGHDANNIGWFFGQSALEAARARLITATHAFLGH
jgi:hypothetical protein